MPSPHQASPLLRLPDDLSIRNARHHPGPMDLDNCGCDAHLGQSGDAGRESWKGIEEVAVRSTGYEESGMLFGVEVSELDLGSSGADSEAGAGNTSIAVERRRLQGDR